MKNILITAPTEMEIKPFEERLGAIARPAKKGRYHLGSLEIEIRSTGIGNTITAFNMARLFHEKYPDLCIQAGIAGSFDPELKIGELVQLRSDQFGFWGARDKDDSPISVFELGLVDPDQFPFKDTKLVNSTAPLPNIKEVSCVTVDAATGSERSISEIKSTYPSDIETMESAAFMYSCLVTKRPFHCIRSISNYIEPRDRSKWEIEMAVKNLSEKLLNIVTQWQ